MFDARIRPLIDPPLNHMGRWFAARGVSANAATLFGMALGLAAAAALSSGHYEIGLALILGNRLLDGVDGAIARVRGPSDFGGYLDIVADFVFYTAIPLGFAFADPANALPAALLLASFALTGISFLAFAAVAARRGMETAAHGRKSIFYSTGLAEGAETIIMFIAMCLLPQYFVPLSLGFAGLCALTVVQRSVLAWRVFGQ
jgi:phosphatidylglycerophosphate synthase